MLILGCWNISLKHSQLHILKGKWGCSNLWPRSVQFFCYIPTFFWAGLHTSLLFYIAVFLSKHKILSRREGKKKKKELLFKEIRLRQKTQKCLFIWSYRYQQNLHGWTGGTNLKNAFEIACCMIKCYWCQNTSVEIWRTGLLKQSHSYVIHTHTHIRMTNSIFCGTVKGGEK